MKYHLVKRNPTLNLSSGKKKSKGMQWFSETRLNGTPAGSKAKEHDMVFLYEVGFAVWGKGEIREIIRPKKLKTLNEVLNYIVNNSNIPSPSYWGDVVFDKVWPQMQQEKFNFLSVLEVKVDVEIIQNPFVLPRKYANQTSWQVLESELKDEQLEVELHKKIPSTLRFQLVNQHNLEGKEHYIDIDHIVPSSLGGPGNIKENLIPVSASYNRYKSNKVPRGLFVVARKFGLLKHMPRLESKESFYESSEAKDVAQKLIAKMHRLDRKTIKSIYREIKKFHYPALFS